MHCYVLTDDARMYIVPDRGTWTRPATTLFTFFSFTDPSGFVQCAYTGLAMAFLVTFASLLVASLPDLKRGEKVGAGSEKNLRRTEFRARAGLVDTVMYGNDGQSGVGVTGCGEGMAEDINAKPSVCDHKH